MLDLRITGAAGDDLDMIWRYTNLRYCGEAANAYLRGFNTTFEFLCEHPEAGAVFQGVKPTTRSFGHRQHRIYYGIDGQRIEVFRITHKAQNVALFFD